MCIRDRYEIVEPKELEKNEIGLNIERYESLIFKLHLIAENIKKVGNKIIVNNRGVNENEKTNR